jgi:hypothetical protein
MREGELRMYMFSKFTSQHCEHHVACMATGCRVEEAAAVDADNQL